MNKYWILLKLQLKSTFNLRDLITSTKTNKKQMRKILLAVILIAAFAPSYWMYNALIQALFDNFSLINQQGAVIAAGVTVTGVVILFFGIMNVFSAFFGAKDLDMLLALPIHPRLIVASKLSSSIIAEYLFAVPLMLPIFINYGINIHAGILFWIIGMILTLTIPIIPLSCCNLIGADRSDCRYAI
jgi:ABC-2 type transport system permease protein